MPRRRMLRTVALLALALPALVPPAAAADSIVYEKDGNVWQARPDGSDQRQVTTAGGYSKPTQADDGTIVAVKDKLLQRMDRGGRVLNTAGDPGGTGPVTPAVSPGGSLVAYNYFNTGSITPGFHTSLSHAGRQTAHGEIFDISGWGNPTWMGNERVLMFDASETFAADTLIYTVGGSTQPWYEDAELSLSGGEVDAGATRFASTDGTIIRLYKLNAPPPAIAVEPRCDLSGPTGSFFRPTWSPDGASLAWEEGDGIWVGSFDLDTCQGDARLTIPGGKAPDWGPANVSSPAPAPTPTPTPTPSAGTTPAPTSNATDTTPPTLASTVARRVRLRVLLRGLKVKASCDEPCRLTADLLLDRRTARRLRLGTGRTVRIGRATRRLVAAGTATFTLRPSARARRRLARGGLRAVTVRVQAVDAAGNRSRAVTVKVSVPR